jgi:hypothetical protein
MSSVRLSPIIRAPQEIALEDTTEQVAVKPLGVDRPLPAAARQTVH